MAQDDKEDREQKKGQEPAAPNAGERRAQEPILQGMASERRGGEGVPRPHEHAHEHEEREASRHAYENAQRSEHPLARIFDDEFLADPFELFRSPERFFNVPQGMRRLVPRVDVSQTAHDVRVVVDVPGVRPDDIDIQADRESLLLRGSMSREDIHEEERPFRYERVSGSFRRRIVLPAPVRPEDVRARYKDGVLTVVLPKDERHSKVKIERE